MKKQATGAYPIRDNKILFLVRQKENDGVHQQGIYLPIGGKVEIGEDIEACARREVLEEAGLTIHDLDLKGIVLIRGQNTGEHDWINFVFTSSNFEGEPTAGNEGSFEWVDVKDLPNVNLYPGDRIYLEHMIQYQFFIADFLYKGFELVEHRLLKAI